jgi:hypothetical protein
VLRNAWKAEKRLSEATVEVTARQGRRDTGGTWTRPDITVLSMRTFRHLAGKHYDVWTFEIKPFNQVDVTGVFEAASHSRCANRSFVMFHVINGESESENVSTLNRCVEEARRFGVGLITFADPGDFGTWDVRVEAPRHEPDPEVLEEFIATQLSEESKDEFMRWQK